MLFIVFFHMAPNAPITGRNSGAVFVLFQHKNERRSEGPSQLAGGR